jgi:hyperosmotically inducible protein
MGSVGISLDDGRIAAAVRTALVNERDLGLRDIAVDVRQGVVFLSGEVRTLEEAQHAATVVRGVQGVRDLTSSLSVKP